MLHCQCKYKHSTNISIKGSSWIYFSICDLAERMWPAGLIEQATGCHSATIIFCVSKMCETAVNYIPVLCVWSWRAITEQLSPASSVVKQCLCGCTDDLADEQLGLQSGVYKSWTCIVWKVVSCFWHSHTLFPGCHKLPLTNGAACVIYRQSEEKKSPADLLSGFSCVALGWMYSVRESVCLHCKCAD